MRFIVKPTPHVTWRFEPDGAGGSVICADEGAGLSCRLPDAPDLELPLLATGWSLAAVESITGILPAYEPRTDAKVRDLRFHVFSWGSVLGSEYTRYDGPLKCVLNRHS